MVIDLSSKSENAKLNFVFGQRVKLLRENLNLSRKALAEILDISDMFLTQIELGQRGVSNVTLIKFADALCTTTDYLLTGRTNGADITSILSLLERMEPPILHGAENLLKEYLNSINYVKSKVEQSQQSTNKNI